MSKIKTYFDTTLDELKNKVSWPTWDELRSSSMLVMVASLIFAVLIWLIDVTGSNVMDFIYKLV